MLEDFYIFSKYWFVVQNVLYMSSSGLSSVDVPKYDVETDDERVCLKRILYFAQM